MNKTNKQNNKATDFQAYLTSKLSNKNFKKYYDEYGEQLQIAYQIVQLRKKANITQLQMSKKIGTTQGNVARIERGQQNFTINLLSRIAMAFGKDLKVSIG